MKNKAIYYTISDLAELGAEKIPEEFSLSSNLVYSSPATLSYNSPGAKGFGVKRGGLAIPDSVMLIISPGCCARNTSDLSRLPQYENRFFYLTMDETDIVTGRHLSKIPEAVAEIVKVVEKKPSVVMLCATCADALLGTDFERVSRKAEEYAGVKVRPCYMYALTREGSKPPMTALRESIYSILEKRKRRPDTVNLMGYFAETEKNSELFKILKNAGVKKINQISTCKNIDEFMDMSEANFNIVLNPEAAYAASVLSEKIGIPYIELKRFYSTERNYRQYKAFFKASMLDASADEFYEAQKAKDEAFSQKYKGLKVSIGECANADPFELALSLSELGLKVVEIFALVTADKYPYIKRLSEISPDTKVYCNQNPSMYYYEAEDEVDITIGADASYYRKDARNLPFNEDIQPFGFAATDKLISEIDELMTSESSEGPAEKTMEYEPSYTPFSNGPKGFRSILTPFAPDQSGASAVFFGAGAFNVIVDAGGCAGNVCGFDEPRWLSERGMIFSAGLRDMDAILGRDKELVEKIAKAVKTLEPELISLTMTPVPAITGTDPKALSRLCEKASGIETISAATNGVELYDKGIEKAEIALAERYINNPDKEMRRVLGFTPLDFPERDQESVEKKWLENGGKADLLIVSNAAIAAAKRLKKKCGLSYEIDWPFAEEEAESLEIPEGFDGKKILIVHSQVRANAVRRAIRKRLPNADIITGGFFMMKDELMEENDVRFAEESDFSEYIEKENFSLIIGDSELKRLIKGNIPEWREFRHFAVSGVL